MENITQDGIMSDFFTCHVMVFKYKLVYVVYAAVDILLHLKSSVTFKE
jgi:hypothetical protein